MLKRPPLPTMLLLISFASVNAVLFTPALPAIAIFFMIDHDTAQQTITFFLIGYAMGQLLYGPVAKRFGGKIALYLGITIQLLSSLICVLAGLLGQYWLLVAARFFLALGSGVGLKMTFTLVNEFYEPQIATQKISYLMLAFAIAPGMAVALGGFLNLYYGWQTCFYAGALYGMILLALVSRLPESKTSIDKNALKIRHLTQAYYSQFKNNQLVIGGMLMGGSTCFVYVFAASMPFIAIDLYGITSAEYGAANMIPTIGLISGSLIGAQLARNFALKSLLIFGAIISLSGSILMLIGVLMNLNIIFSIFLPMSIIYFGLCLIMANASTLAMAEVADKAHGSAVMNFLNMGLATLVVMSLGLFPVSKLMLPAIFLILSLFMLSLIIWKDIIIRRLQPDYTS